MLKNRSMSNSRTFSFAYISKSWFIQNWRSLFEIIIVNEFSSVLKQKQFEKSEINAIVLHITNIEFFAKHIVSKFTNSQWSSFEINIVYEFSSILEKILCDFSKINTVIVNIESKKNEIFVFESNNWNVAVAKKKIFDFTFTFDAISKSSRTSHIEKNIKTKNVAKSIVNVKIQNQKIFVLIALYDTFLKNSFALYSKNIEISISENMSSFEHFINENSSAIETFDFDIKINTFCKNSLIQHIENAKTLKIDSIYELFAFFIFDFSIDIDFEIYTIDLVTYSNIQSFSSSISSITLQVIEATSNYEKKQFSTCFVDHATSCYKKKQFSTCFVEWTTSKKNRKNVYHTISNYEREQFSTCFVDYIISCYEKKQIICFANIVNTISNITKFIVTKFIVTKFIVTKSVHHALLIYCLIWI